MSADDHLSGQFEVVKPHRLVRVGDRHYPAVFTSSEENPHLRHAVIPMENGGLVSVSHWGDNPSAEMAAPGMQVTGHGTPEREEIKARGNQDLFRSVGSIWGVQDFHRSMDAMAKQPVDQEAMQNNQRIMKENVAMFHNRGD